MSDTKSTGREGSRSSDQKAATSGQLRQSTLMEHKQTSSEEHQQFHSGSLPKTSHEDPKKSVSYQISGPHTSSTYS